MHPDLYAFKRGLVAEFPRVESNFVQLDKAFHSCMYLLLSGKVDPQAAAIINIIVQARHDLKYFAVPDGNGWKGLQLHPFVESYTRSAAALADPTVQGEWIKRGYLGSLKHVLAATSLMASIYGYLRWLGSSPDANLLDGDAQWMLRIFKLRG